MSSGVETTNSSRGFHYSNISIPQWNIDSIPDTENTLLDEKLDSKDLALTKTESKEEKEDAKEGETKKRRTLNDDMPWQTLVSYVDELTIGARRDSKGKYVDGVGTFPGFGKQKVPKVPSNCFPATFYDRLLSQIFPIGYNKAEFQMCLFGKMRTIQSRFRMDAFSYCSFSCSRHCRLWMVYPGADFRIQCHSMLWRHPLGRKSQTEKTTLLDKPCIFSDLHHRDVLQMGGFGV